MDPITTAIVSSVIGSVIQGAITAPPEPPPVPALVRMMPPEARLGQMSPPALAMSGLQWQVQIDGTAYALSPGAQFRNEMNRVVLPSMIQQPARVRYLTDPGGAVHRVWMLTDAEARLPEGR